MAEKTSRAGGVRRRGRSAAPPQPTLSAFDAGIELLARRPHGVAELGRRLARKGYDADVLEPALRSLAELGYLDDASFAEDHVARRAGKRGPRALAAELTARGLDREIVQAALGVFDREAQVRMAARLVRREIGTRRPPSYKELLAKEGPRLLRRGYSHSVAWAACRAVWAGAEATSGGI